MAQNNDAPELFVLSDESGETMSFHFLDIICYRDREYLLLLPAEGPFTDEVVILQRERDENGEESYVDPPDAKTRRAVFALFRERAGDRFLFSD